MNTPRLIDYLGHIVQAIDRIDRYTAGLDEAGFRAHDMAHDAVIRNLEVIGEACRNIERERPDFAAARPELPLGRAYAMRNALSHGYFKVDLSVVWRTLRNDLPGLRRQVQALLDDGAVSQDPRS